MLLYIKPGAARSKSQLLRLAWAAASETAFSCVGAVKKPNPV